MKVTRDIEGRFREKTPKAGKLHERALRFMPGGETRESTSYEPYTAYMDRGKGCYLWDIDGNEYIDFVGNYTSLIHGHCDPDIQEAVRTQIEKGCALSSTSVLQIEHAQILCDRVPSVESVRYANSGTEAAMWALRLARAFTGKDMFLKFEGCYHGTHDAAKISVIPDFEPDPLPKPQLQGKGIPKSVLQDVVVAPFNDLEVTEAQLKKHGGKIGCIIIEPFLGNLGAIAPKPGFLQGVRDLADRYDALLVYDEVQSIRQTTGGFQQYAGVYPDITALGKFIGGGYPVGAFGGRKDIMALVNSYDDSIKSVNHTGTFNGNEVTMAAGIASMKKYDEVAADHINRLGAYLRNAGNRTFEDLGIKCRLSGTGSLSFITYTDTEVSNATDFIVALVQAEELQKLVHLDLINRGIFTAKRGEFVISTPMTKKEVETGILALRETFEYLKPYIEENAAHLI